ncbi:MAG: ribosomal protein S18-alanine N-acetyltransferase [Vicinamibacterales bacterium]
MMDCFIQPVTSEQDIDDLLRIESATFTRPWTREMYLSELEHRDVSFFYVARDAVGEAIGFCSWWLVLDEIHVNNLAVLPEHRRAGVASALLERVLADGATRGAHRATLEVRRSNVPALRLYEKFGFSVAAVRRNYYSHPEEDALVLWREPSPLGRS